MPLIVRQPTGKYAVWSDVVDDFIMIHCTREEIIADRVETATKEITERVNKDCDSLDKGGKPYFQFTMTWDEALKMRKEMHPDVEDLPDER